jgi:hypothetical protein
VAGGCDHRRVAPYPDLPPRRPLLVPVLIAAVFLAIIGLSVGLVMGSRANRSAPRGQERTTTPVSVVTTSPTSRAPACRQETQDVAQRFEATGTLVVKLQIRTETSAVWICADDADRLFYHANRGGAEAVWIEGKTALFLSGVASTGDGYRVTATDAQKRVTVFEVTRRALSITHHDGGTEVQPVREVVVG